MAVVNTVKEAGNLAGWIVIIVCMLGGGMWLIVAAGGTVEGTAKVVRDLWALGWSLIGDLLNGTEADVPVAG